jgi:hypothetical protein
MEEAMRFNRALRGSLLSLTLLIDTRAPCSRVFAADTRSDIRAGDVLKEAYNLGSRYQGLSIDFLWCREIERILPSHLNAGDLDSAFETLKVDRPIGSRSFDFELAVALARSGRRKEAEDWMRKVEKHGCCGGDPVEYHKSLEDQLRVAFLQHQIATGNLAAASKSQQEITTSYERPIAARELAVGYAKAGDVATSKRLFRDAVDASLAILIKKPAAADNLYSDDWSRTHALWEICDAQMTVRDSEGASETLQALVKAAEAIRHGLSRMESLHEAASRSALLGDRDAAKRLFIEAVDCRDAVKPPIPCAEGNKAFELRRIAKSQAEFGFLEDALKTAQLISIDKWDRFRAIGEVAAAFAKAGQIDRAREIALSINAPRERRYRDEALTLITRRQIDRRELESALTTADKIDDALDRALARLEVAVEFAILGDRKAAADTAAQIRLSQQARFINGPKIVFDYQSPRTWGVIYDNRRIGDLRGHTFSIRRSSKLASTAFKLSHFLERRYPESFAISFAELYPETVFAVAREQTVLGETQDALAWARQIGTPKLKGAKIVESDRFGADMRIAALLGVAEGILERQGKLPRSEEN